MAIGSVGGSSGGLSGNTLQPSPIPLKGKFVSLFKRLKVTSEPSQEPITLAELKAWLKITTDDEDTLLTGLIVAARSEIESYLRKKLITQELTMVLDQWPFSSIGDWEGNIETAIGEVATQVALKLWYPPLQSVTSITATFQDDTTQVWPAINYIVDTSTEDDYGRIIIKRDATLLVNLREAVSIAIIYLAGYGDNPSDVPFAIRQAILVYSAYLYQNRGDCAGSSKTSYKRGETPLDISGSAGMLGRFRLERLVN